MKVGVIEYFEKDGVIRNFVNFFEFGKVMDDSFKPRKIREFESLTIGIFKKGKLKEVKPKYIVEDFYSLGDIVEYNEEEDFIKIGYLKTPTEEQYSDIERIYQAYENKLNSVTDENERKRISTILSRMSIQKKDLKQLLEWKKNSKPKSLTKVL